jgi:hypothetical protein
MPLYIMDCYSGGLHPADAVLRESLQINAPSRTSAIEEAHRRAERITHTFFELRDANRKLDNVFYNSQTGEA